MQKIIITRNLKINLLDDFIYSMVKQIEEFDYTNQKISNYLGVSKASVDRSLNRLRKNNLIYNHSFDGHRRVLKLKD